MSKVPKQYECLNCGFVSNKSKPLKFPSMTFATCFKCGGRVKERQEWSDWLHTEQKKFYRIGV